MLIVELGILQHLYQDFSWNDTETCLHFTKRVPNILNYKLAVFVCRWLCDSPGDLFHLEAVSSGTLSEKHLFNGENKPESESGGGFAFL